MTGRSAMLRWAVNITTWEPEGEEHGSEFQFLLSLMPKQDAEKVMKFVFFDDKKRALLSRLLQRRCCERVTGLAWDKIDIQRTKGSKPFMANIPAETSEYAPNFNFNVSHEGDYVVLASEPNCIVGVDVAAPGQLRRKGQQHDVEEMFRSFSNQFTSYEWGLIRSEKTDIAKEDVFRRHWSMKEAYVKGRGDGLGFELGKCEFHPGQGGNRSQTATVVVEGMPAPQWKFFLEPLGPEHKSGRHWVTVARGPPEDVVDAHGVFKKTLTRKSFWPDEWEELLNAPSPSMVTLIVSDLVPEHLRAQYLAAGGEDDDGL